ncbi:F-box/FBD/LRR-repeat protein At1g13570 isoform X1 [Helianthus annuus]|uniref:F-box/FBD/LRR-repeat protein At1g13570 isoform X1 n=1 Tax=Helianthus annuus TaxID=4232 RepID=UPI000B907A93|nr:F-box/FBD/LRR-repeat protein At1g13570 isoform X1 [Helianthus annuus]
MFTTMGLGEHQGNKMHGEDYITDLPESIIETILTKLPLRDAVRTSVLSSKWRYKWATLTELEFNDTCVSVSHIHSSALAAAKLVKFVNQFLLLHDGPINRFTIYSSYLQRFPYLDQWLLFLSRKDVQELNIGFCQGDWFRAPSCLFSCKKLTALELVRCVLHPPLYFKGFPNLKHLTLQQVHITRDAVENLISSCTLLESLTLLYFDSRKLTIRAPNLTCLVLEGEFKDICLENTPMLAVISVAMYINDDIAQHYDQSSSCNFDQFLGGVPSIQRLTGHGFFTKYMSIGNTLGEIQPTYRQLKVIDLYQVSFDNLKEIMVILRLLLSAPNLQVLQIGGSADASLATDAVDLDFWDKECPRDATFEQLKSVKMTQMLGLPHEMRFIEFLLGNSPVLELMDIAQNVHDETDENHDQSEMYTEILGFETASAEVVIEFTENYV